MAETTCDMNTKQMPEFQLNSQNFIAEYRKSERKGEERFVSSADRIKKNPIDHSSSIFSRGLCSESSPEFTSINAYAE